ncbi:MAG TPA: hypothetical protein VKX46_12195 [Ktedonobacteraceae bacterium]|nr:hypothetical protein [Ktedonobacteraceae bacterium]
MPLEAAEFGGSQAHALQTQNLHGLPGRARGLLNRARSLVHIH